MTHRYCYMTDPLHGHAFERMHFNYPGVREGRLTSLPMKIISALTAGACVKSCLLETNVKCLGVNFDSAGSNTCELLTDVEGPGVYLRLVT